MSIYCWLGAHRSLGTPRTTENGAIVHECLDCLRLVPSSSKRAYVPALRFPRPNTVKWRSRV